MKKNVLYVVVTLIAIGLVAIFSSHSSETTAMHKVAATGSALPTNGMTEGTTAKQAPQAAAPAMSSALPAPATTIPAAPTMGDDVPAGAEVSGEAITAPMGEAPKPTEDKGMTLPASEGQ